MTVPSKWSPGKTVLALLGALILAAAVLQGLESLAVRETGMSHKDGARPTATRNPVRPTLERVDDWTIEIREDLWRRSTFRFNEDDGLEEANAVYACLEAGIAREFDDDPTFSHREMRSRVMQIRNECSPIDLPPLPHVGELD
jgi:hypothetical protein